MIPRRNRLDKNEPAELAIRNAVDEIEKIGADERLTNAVNLLHQARELIADFIDDKCWWLKLSKEEMPKYYRVDGAFNEAVWKIGEDAEWNYYQGELLGVSYKRGGGGTLIHYLIPATEEEYNQQFIKAQ